MATPLTPGTTLGPYEIQSAVGAGGMGEVYRARDTRLDRTVAIKILTADPAEPAAVRERFEREARAISQLNHAHVCTLYDIGEQTSDAGEPLRYLVMEFVEGEPLAARLERGPLPLDQALTFAIQIADALDKVHRRGIVHGDLKPGNIMVTKGGVKLLDFGLATLRQPAPPGGWPDEATRTVPIATARFVLGTLQYLSPEQIEGRDSDERSDIFACGAVIYEMLTGRKAFAGETHSAVMTAIMTRQPPALSTVQPAVSPALEHVVATCLAKDPDDRWQHAGDLARQLQWVSSAQPAGGVRAAPRRSPVWIAASAVLLLAVASLAWLLYQQRAAPLEQDAVRTSILLPDGLQFPAAGEIGGIERFALSPDGRQLAFTAVDASGNQMLWVRPLGSMAAAALPGTQGAVSPFWAPDSQRVAFFSRGQLKVASVQGGSPAVVASPAFAASGAWNANDDILFTPALDAPLHQVSVRGGTPRPVTSLDRERADLLHRNPVFLPDGRHFLYVAVSAREGNTTAARGLYAASLDGGEAAAEVVAGGTMAKYARGHLLYLQENTLVAQPFDPDALRLTGEARTIAEQLELTGPSTAAFAVSRDGLLAYQGASGPGSQLVWFSREGRSEGVLGDPARYGDLALSPDGSQVVVSILDPGSNTRDLWLLDVDRNVRTRLTFDPADDVAPAWSPDGTRVAFASNREGHFDLYQKPVNGIGQETPILADDTEKYPTAWLPDGRSLVFWTFDTEGTRLVELPLTTEDAQTRTALDAPVSQGSLSPDGRWLAYYSPESGTFEVYVVPFPAVSRRWQVSAAGGRFPVWRRDGREIVYAGRDNRLMSVTVTPRDGTLEVGVPQPLFEARPAGPRSFFAISADGQRVLVNALQAQGRSPAITLFQNWAPAGAP